MIDPILTKYLFVGHSPLEINIEYNVPSGFSVEVNGVWVPANSSTLAFVSTDQAQVIFETEEGEKLRPQPINVIDLEDCDLETCAHILRREFQKACVVHIVKPEVNENERYAVLRRGSRIELAKLAAKI